MFTSDPLRHEIEWAKAIGHDAALMAFAGCNQAAISEYVRRKWPAGEMSLEKFLQIARASYRELHARLAGKSNAFYAAQTFAGELVLCQRQKFALACSVDGSGHWRGLANLIGFDWQAALASGKEASDDAAAAIVDAAIAPAVAAAQPATRKPSKPRTPADKRRAAQLAETQEIKRPRWR